jgi:hypothetical protein
LHAKNANLKVIGAATANAYISNDLYKAYPNDPNGFSFHWYGGGGWTVMREAAQSEWPYYAQYHATFNTKNLPFYVTEWSPLGATTGDVSNDFNKTVGAALCYMDMIGAFQRTGVDGYTMFGCNIQVEDNWGILCSSMDYRALDLPGPAYFTLPMWTKTGPFVLPTVCSDDSALVMSTYANKKSDGSVQVFLINKAAVRSATVSFQGYNPTGATVSIYEFRPATAGNVASQNWYYNNVSDANLRPATSDLPAPTTETCSGTTYTRSLPAYSATMLDFKGGTVNGVKLRYERVAPGVSMLQSDRSIKISITGTWDAAIKSIRIYDLDGKLVSNIPASINQKEFAWDASQIKPGTYAIRAETGTSIFTKSFCVKN